MTCGFGRNAKLSLTVWLGFWLGHLCDVDHMESRGVWCRTALRSVQAVPYRELTQAREPGQHEDRVPVLSLTPGRSVWIGYAERRCVLAISPFGDVAAALRKHGSATLDEHCCHFRRPD